MVWFLLFISIFFWIVTTVWNNRIYEENEFWVTCYEVDLYTFLAERWWGGYEESKWIIIFVFLSFLNFLVKNHKENKSNHHPTQWHHTKMNESPKRILTVNERFLTLFRFIHEEDSRFLPGALFFRAPPGISAIEIYATKARRMSDLRRRFYLLYLLWSNV